MLSYQIKAFLNQRLVELRNEETLSLRNQVQSVAPLVLQQYSPDAIETMLSDVAVAISLLTNRKTRDQIMIINSKRCCYIISDWFLASPFQLVFSFVYIYI